MMSFVDVGPNAEQGVPQDRTVSVDTAGNQLKPSTLLFVHGNPTWSFYWRKLVGPLSREHRCVAIDHIGCGRSDKPVDYPYSLTQHIENLVSLIESLELDNLTLVAHDWGGAIGLGAAVRMPNRFSRIVLLNTAAFPPPYIPLRIRACRIPLFGTIALRGLNLFSRAALKMAVEDPQSLDADARAGLLAPYDSWANRVAIQRFVQDIPTSPGQSTWGKLEEIEAKLELFMDRPVKLIWGMKDWCFRPSCLARLESIFPHADVTRIESAGHYVVEEAHEEVLNSLRKFLLES